jgi:hypothetical protein
MTTETPASPPKTAPARQAGKFVSTKSAAKPAGNAPASHHVKARIFALEALMARGVTLEALTAEAKTLEAYLLGGDPSPDQVDARIMAVKITWRGAIKGARLIDEAKTFETYILHGEARPAPKRETEVPSTRRERPAGDRTTRDSKVPGEPGEAGDIARQSRRPSERKSGFEVQV